MADMANARLEILSGPAALARRAAAWLTGLANEGEGMFSLALAGGQTPRLLYRCLASSLFRDSFPWARTHFFWGDERFVPHDDPRSNYRMAREAMLAHVPVPTANVHAIPTEGIEPEAAAAAYERELGIYYGASRLDPLRPLFDLVLLGLGADGHVASLFPGAALVEVRDRWVGTTAGAAPETRISLTLPALESARHMALLVVGENKRAVLSRLRRGDARLPATQLRPLGTFSLFADRAAIGAQA